MRALGWEGELCSLWVVWGCFPLAEGIRGDVVRWALSPCLLVGLAQKASLLSPGTCGTPRAFTGPSQQLLLGYPSSACLSPEAGSVLWLEEECSFPFCMEAPTGAGAHPGPRVSQCWSWEENPGVLTPTQCVLHRPMARPALMEWGLGPVPPWQQGSGSCCPGPL